MNLSKNSSSPNETNFYSKKYNNIESDKLANQLFNRYKNTSDYVDLCHVENILKKVYCFDLDLYENTIANRQDDNLQEFFELMDMDGDGKVSLEDLKVFTNMFYGPDSSNMGLVKSSEESNNVQKAPIITNSILQDSHLPKTLKHSTESLGNSTIFGTLKNLSRKNSIRKSMSMQQFDKNNLDIALDVFDNEFDLDNDGTIQIKEIPALISRICFIMDYEDFIARETINEALQRDEHLRNREKIYKNEFAELYLKNFNQMG